MPYVTTEGTRLWVDVDNGPSGADWIIVSNSLAADTSMWDGQMPLLTQHFNVIRYDTRGHGQSDALAGDYTLQQLVADCRGLLDHFGVPKAAFLGLSLGGMTGLGMALSSPERLTRLICCDARADATPPFVQSWIDRIAAVRAGGMEAIADLTLERWLNTEFREQNPVQTEGLRKMILGTKVAGYCGCATALMGLDYLRQLHAIQVPVSYVVGADDTGAPPDTMKEMAARTPGSTLDIVPGAAHLPNIDNRDAFNRILESRLLQLAE